MRTPGGNLGCSSAARRGQQRSISHSPTPSARLFPKPECCSPLDPILNGSRHPLLRHLHRLLRRLLHRSPAIRRVEGTGAEAEAFHNSCKCCRTATTLPVRQAQFEHWAPDMNIGNAASCQVTWGGEPGKILSMAPKTLCGLIMSSNFVLSCVT